MNTQMIKALTAATRANISPVVCWWGETETNDLVNEAVKQGWVKRHSVTQVEWTEKGIEEYKNAYASIHKDGDSHYASHYA